MALSTKPEKPLDVWKRLEAEQPQGTTDFTLRPASFAHVAGSGYAAGYYGYMWSEVIALDMLSAFEGHMLDPAVGARYRGTILAQGGQEEEMDMVRKFLGRSPTTRRSSRRSPASGKALPQPQLQSRLDHAGGGELVEARAASRRPCRSAARCRRAVSPARTM
jgi:hypothetical protein